MSTVVENLTGQIDGVEQTFTTVNSILDGVYITLNGIAQSGEDYAVDDANNFTMQISPDIGDELLVFITPTMYDISGQIQPGRRIFDKVDADTSNADFLAILNGVLYNTTKISDTQFDLGFVPEATDELLYMRGLFVISVQGQDKAFSVSGTISTNTFLGDVDQNILTGVID